jgi:regulator of sigma E protease
VAFAGPMMNVLFAFVIAAVIYLVGLPQLVNPSVIGVLDPESEEYRMGIREDDRIVEVNGEPVKSWQDVHMATVLARTNVLQVVIARDGERMTYSLDAKENEVLGGLKMLNLNPQGHPKIVEAQEGKAAAEAGLEPEDMVVSFAGVPIYSQKQLIELIQKRGGQETKIEIERGGELLTVSITPRVVDKEGRGQIGAIIGSDTKPVYELMRPGPTPWAQVKDVWNKTIATLSALIHSKETGVGAKDLSGPVGILAMLGAQVNTDYRLALSFLVLLNINLAILNLLPVPVLDGGHILMALIEKIIRRPLSVRLIEYTTTAFALLLISFMLYVSFHDIKRFSLFRSMFRNDARIEQPADAPIPETGAPSE